MPWICSGQSRNTAEGACIRLSSVYAEKSKALPILEVSDVGDPYLKKIAKDCNIATDIPKYRIYEKGVMTGEYDSVEQFWRDDLVAFLIGCSFSFESELLDSGITVRHIEEHKNVPMYLTNIDCEPAGVFSGKMVVSMRPLPRDQIVKAVNITSSMPRVHGTPIQIGHPEQIGISDINKPDFGDAVTVKPGENTCILGLRRNSAVYNDEFKARLLHNACSGSHAYYRH